MSGDEARAPLRWFTPTVEVPLCGHATLAAGAALMERYEEVRVARFSTLSGALERGAACDGWTRGAGGYQGGRRIHYGAAIQPRRHD